MSSRRSVSQSRRRAGHLGGIALAASLVPASSALVQAGPEDVAAVLARMREAAGTRVLQGRTGDLLIEGKSDRYGSAGGYSLRFAPSGKFLFRIDGRLTETCGFDERTCWMVDSSGMPRTLELSDREHRQLGLGLQTGLWLAHLDPGSVALAPEGSDRDTVVLDIRHGRLKAKLTVSRATWLPAALKWAGVRGEETRTFTDYRDEAGWKVPGKITTTLGGAVTVTYEVRTVRPAPAAPADVYAPVMARPDDTRFNPAVPPQIEVKRARTGHVLVHPRIDGLDLGWFIFDTGAGGSTVLHTEAAAKLKRTPVGHVPVTHFLGQSSSTMLRGESLELGPVIREKPLFLEMDLGFVRKAIGEEVAGIIGYDLLSRCVAEIELARDSIKLHDPSHYRLESGAWQKLTLHQALPVVPATFEGGRTGLFRIDVGASGEALSNVIFHAPAVEELQLLKGRQVTHAKLGPTAVALGTIAWFELAGHRFKNPAVVFALDRKGPFGDSYVEGNLGVEFLKPFRIVLDYSHERVAFLRLSEERR